MLDIAVWSPPAVVQPIGLLLFDDSRLAGADKHAFVGLEASRRISVTPDCRQAALTTLLGGYGHSVSARPDRVSARRRGDSARHDHSYGREAAGCSGGVEDTKWRQLCRQLLAAG